MNRLWIVVLFFVSAAPALAQEPGRIYRVGVLSPSPRSLETFREMAGPELARLGFVEGQNLTLTLRVRLPEALPQAAKDLIDLKPDAIVAISTVAATAVHAATATIPIVLYGGDDPVALGLAASFAHPGANLTGFTIMSVGLDAKRLDLLRQAVPHAKRVAALVHPAYLNRDASVREMQAVAAGLGFDLVIVFAAGPADYPGAFARMREAGAQALAITASASFFTDTALLIQLAAEARLPTVCEWREMAELGCVLGYGPSRRVLFGRIADYVARILRGANPGDLPIEQPAALELVVNAKVARATDLDIPPTLLIRADEVIE